MCIQCVQNSGTAILLTNSVGCILDLVGDEDIVRIMEQWGAGRGSILSEERIGTTSIGLALTERMPVQVAGREHFAKQFHVATGAAAPIFDISGRLLGILGQVMPVERYHVHSLGLVVAAARAVENQHQSDLLLAEQNSQLAQLNTILSTISDGILVWNTQHMVVHANHAASQMLGTPAQFMVGKLADTFLGLPAFVEEALQLGKPLTDVEGVIDVDGRAVHCLISLDFVFKSPDRLQWIIVTLRSEKKVRKLIQQQVGATAALTLSDIPGEAPQMQRVRNFVRSAAGARASILIRGEVGTGKNALASAIHNAGPWHDGPFVIFASSSVPAELVVSDLLGYDEFIENSRGERTSQQIRAGAGRNFVLSGCGCPASGSTGCADQCTGDRCSPASWKPAPYSGGSACNRLHPGRYGGLDLPGSIPPGSLLSPEHIYHNPSASAGAPV